MKMIIESVYNYLKNIKYLPSNYLTYLANGYKTDKGTLWGNRHNYTSHYHKLFQSIRNKKLNILEVGLCHSEKQYDVPSLKTWLKYFPYSNIYGFDISDFSFFSHKRAAVFRGDQGSRSDLRRCIELFGVEFDIIIDDGSHASHHQQITLGTLFPHLIKGGFYCIEDLNWQPKTIEVEGVEKTKAILLRYHKTQRFESKFLSEEENNFIQKEIKNIFFYNSACEFKYGNENGLCIIKKV